MRRARVDHAGRALCSFELVLPNPPNAGGAGLRIAHGLLFPGLLPRKDSLAIAGRDATMLVLGTVPILIIAGTIEAFVSPTGLAIPLKFAMSAALLGLLSAYLFGVGREDADIDGAPGSASLSAIIRIKFRGSGRA